MMKGEEARKFRLQKAVTAVSAFALAAIVTLCANGAVRYPGDVNTDKIIDISDAVLLARYLVEDPGALLSRAGVDNADANSDGKTDTEDVILIVKQVAKYVPMPPNPYEEGYTEPATTAAVTTTETTATETLPNGTESKPSQGTETDGIQLTADTVPYPLGVSISVLTGQTQPNEMLTVNYDVGNIIFAIFANDPLETTIAIAYQDNIVGYYKFCREYTVPEGYEAREFRDMDGLSDAERQKPNAGELYAVLVMREDVSIDFPHLSDTNDMSVLAKLNYYGSNGIRAAHGLAPLKWNEEVSKLAHAHCVDMGEKNYFDHISHNENGLFVFYEVDGNKYPLNRVLADVMILDDDGTPEEDADDDMIYYLVDESGSPQLGTDGQRIVLMQVLRTQGQADTVLKTDGYSPCNVGVRMDLHGIDWCRHAENIDYGYTDPFTALNGWVNSPAHRENLLSDKYSDIGVGFAYDSSSDYLYFGTQDFCSLFT